MGQRACGKLNALEGVLRSFDRRDKVLLFSFSVQMLDVLAAFATFKGALTRRVVALGLFLSGSVCGIETTRSTQTTGYEFVRLDGSVTGNERQAVIECESLVLACLVWIYRLILLARSK